MVSDEVDIAALKKRIDGLDPQFNIKATSVDGNLDVVLHMENIRRILCQATPCTLPSSDTAPTNNGRIANPFKWATCVTASDTSARVVSKSPSPWS